MEFVPRHTDLVSLLQESFRRFERSPLFGTREAGGWRWRTYGEVSREVDRTRAALAALGVRPGDKVACISDNRVEWAVGAWASFGLGAAWVPMYPAQLDGDWRHILGDSGARVCFVATRALADRVARLRPELPALEHVVCFAGAADLPDTLAALLARGAPGTPARTPSPQELACLVYTSGTTGRPRGVLLTHSNLACNVSALETIIPFHADDRSLSFLPWAHAFGQTMELHLLTAIGASLALCERVDRLVEDLAEVQPTVLVAVPRIFNRLHDNVQRTLAQGPAAVRALFRTAMAAAGEERRGRRPGAGARLALAAARRLVFPRIRAKLGGRLRYVVSGSAALSPEIAEFIDHLGIVFYEGYGLTETSPVAAANTPQRRRIGTVGVPLPGVTIELDRSVSPDPEVGEIVVRGHNVMAGYHNLPEETARALTGDGGLRTGDLGSWDADGFLCIRGRLKEQYKLENGKYVAPAALEERIALSPYISQVMVHGANRPYNVAVVVPDLPALAEWARREGLAAQQPGELLAHERTQALVRAEIDRLCGDARGYDRVRRFTLVPEEFSVANDLLSQTLKLKRGNVLRRYGADLEALYREESGAQA